MSRVFPAVDGLMDFVSPRERAATSFSLV